MRISTRFARILVRGRWVVVGAWIAAVLAALFLLPSTDAASGGTNLSGLVPADTPAVQAELREVKTFGFPLLGRAAVVQRAPDGLSAAAQAQAASAAVAVNRKHYPGLENVAGALPLSNAFGIFPESREVNTTALTYLLFRPDVSLSQQTRETNRYAHRFFRPGDHVVGVTGSVPARVAQGDYIQDALPLAELLTLGAIVIIVGLALRSVVAPIVALLSAAVAYVMTVQISGVLVSALGISAPSELEPVVVALLLGVVTDYVVFYLTAMRGELREGHERLTAAERATTAYGPIVLVAGLAVAAGAGSLLVAHSLFFRALGPALIFTVLIGLVVAVTLVPALMAVFGRWCFWPSRPDRAPQRPTGPVGDVPDEVVAQDLSRTLRGRLIALVTGSRRAAAIAVVLGAGGLALAAVPATHLQLGVSFVGSLPARSEVAQAAAQAEAGFAPGILSPTTLVLEGNGLADQQAALTRLGATLESEAGVAGVLGPGDVGSRLSRNVLVRADGSAARLLIVLDADALGARAITTVDRLQSDLPRLLRQAGVTGVTSSVLTGDTATAAYIVDQTNGDLVRIALAALGANLVMLLLFLRAVVAAAYLLVGSILSLGASLGLTQFVFGQVQPGEGLTFYVPFAAAVLLLAFGSDYNIYSVGSIWEAARLEPLRRAVRRTMPHSMSAVFAAGVALTASFGMLAVVPLAPFRELAFMMGIGILLDVIVVRSVLLPAMLTLVGRVSAWPSSRLAPDEADPSPVTTYGEQLDPPGSYPLGQPDQPELDDGLEPEFRPPVFATAGGGASEADVSAPPDPEPDRTLEPTFVTPEYDEDGTEDGPEISQAPDR